MKWANRNPVMGSERTVIVFAYWPIPCDKGHTHWLEHVKIRQWWGEMTETWRKKSTTGVLNMPECFCPDEEEGKR